MKNKTFLTQTEKEIDTFLINVIRTIKPRVVKTDVYQNKLVNQYHTSFRNYGVVAAFVGQTDRCQRFLDKHPVLMYIQLYTYCTLSVIVFTAVHAVAAALMCLVRVYFQDTEYPYSQTRLLVVVTTIQYWQYSYVDEEDYQRDVLMQREDDKNEYVEKIDMYKQEKKEKEEQIKNGTYKKQQREKDSDDKDAKDLADYYQSMRDKLPEQVAKQEEKIRKIDRKKIESVKKSREEKNS